MKITRRARGGICRYSLPSGVERWAVRYRDRRGKWMVRKGIARQAEAIAIKQELDSERRTWATSERMTLAAAVKLYRSERIEAGRRESSYNYLPLWVGAYGARGIDDLTPDEIQGRLDEWHAAKGWSPAARNRALSQVSGLYTWAQAKRLVSQHPVRGWIGKLPESGGRTRWLRMDEIEEIRRHSPPWLSDIVRLAVATGMRLGELCGLRRASVRIIDGEVAYLITEGARTKNGKALAWPVDGSLYDWAVERVELLQFPGSYLLPGPEGGNAHTSIRRHLPKAVRAAKIAWGASDPQGVTFHTFRHSMASLGLAAGIPTESLQKLGNWSDPRMVSRYAHLADEQLRAAAKTMRLVVDGPGALEIEPSQTKKLREKSHSIRTHEEL